MALRYENTENGGIRVVNEEPSGTVISLENLEVGSISFKNTLTDIDNLESRVDSIEVQASEAANSCEFGSSSDFLITTDNKEFRLGLDGRDGVNSIESPKRVVRDPDKDWVYVASKANPGFLSSYDISCPEKPVYGDLDQVTVNTSGPNDCATTGEYTFMVTNNGNLTVTDTSDPEDLNRVQTLFTGVGQLFHVDINDAEDLAAAANTTGDGLLVFDIADPENASFVGQDGGFDAGGAVFIDNTTVAVTNFGGSEIRTYDVSDPTSPSVIDTLSIGSFPVSIGSSPSRDAVYVGEFNSTTAYVVNATDPSALSQAKTLDTATVPVVHDSFQSTSEFLYVFTGKSGDGAIRVYDNSNIFDPQLEYTYTFEGGPTIDGPVVDGGIGYVGRDDSDELIAVKLNTHYNTAAPLTSANILDVFKLRTDVAPSAASDPGEEGEIRIGEDSGSFYLYAYLSGGWKRTQLTSW